MKKVDVMTGAIRSIIAYYKQPPPSILGWQPSSILPKAIRSVYLRIFEVMDSYTDIKTWPLVASAMNIGVTELNDGREELIAEEYATLTKTILKVSDETKRNSSSQVDYARWCGRSDNKDVITNLLLPTYNAIEHNTGTTAKTELFELIKNEAVASVNEVKKRNPMPCLQRQILQVKRASPT